MNQPHHTIRLRAARGYTLGAVCRQHPKGCNATTINLSMHWPEGVPAEALKITEVRCDGVALKHRQDGHQVTVSPMLRLEGERIEVDLTGNAPGSPVQPPSGGVEGRREPEGYHPTRKPLRPAPAPVYGFTPREVRA